MKTKTLNSDKEFQVGQHNIGWLDTDLTKRFKDVDFEKRPLGTFQKLGKSMTVDEFEKELKPGLCELGDVLAFLENPPEECKDGWGNLFLVGSFVVVVYWCGSGWDVGCSGRDAFHWGGDYRVFSPATSKTPALDTIPSDTLTLGPKSLELAIQICKDAGLVVSKVY